MKKFIQALMGLFRAPPAPTAKAEKKKKFRPFRRMATKISERETSSVGYLWPLKVPELPKGVVPEGQQLLIAQDAIPTWVTAESAMSGGGFPGYAHLAQLATKSEHRAMAESISGELTRKWIELYSKSSVESSGDKISQIQDELNRLEFREVMKTVAAHDCNFGRGQVYIEIKDADPEMPLILDNRSIKKGSLVALRAVEPIWTTPAAYNSINPLACDFFKPTMWFVVGQKVHSTRLDTVITRPVPDILKAAFNFSGISLTQMAEPYVDNWLRTRTSVSNLVANFSTTVLATSMDGVLSGDDEDGDSVLDRARFFTAARDNQGLMMLDKEREDIIQVNTPLSGLHELLSQSQEQMGSVSRIPSVILTGISPSGLNASSEGEITVFYDWINSVQESHYRGPVDLILKVVQLSLFGEIDPDIGYKFVPLKQMSALEEAEIRLSDSQVACSFIDHGVISPEEQREKLAKDINSGYQGIKVADLPEVPEANNFYNSTKDKGGGGGEQ